MRGWSLEKGEGYSGFLSRLLFGHKRFTRQYNCWLKGLFKLPVINITNSSLLNTRPPNREGLPLPSGPVPNYIHLGLLHHCACIHLPAAQFVAMSGASLYLDVCAHCSFVNVSCL
jgi:hypothetical protein